MVNALLHRGPDDDGVETVHAANPAVIFGRISTHTYNSSVVVPALD